MDLKHIERLASVQEDAARKTENDIKLLEKYADEYRALKEQLSTLPDRVSYDIMVPFGNVAFMPGRLVHTNEIRVLLGDDWFVDRSAKQAVEIVDRRLKIVVEDVAGLKRQRDLFKPHLDFTKEFREQAQQEAQIVEEYNEDDEKAWRAQHRLNVKKHYEEQREARDAEKLKDEDEYWKRMEEAEAEEEENEEPDTESSRTTTVASGKSETVSDLHPLETLPSTTKTPSNDIERKPTQDNSLRGPSKHESTNTSMKKKNAGKSVRWQDIEQNAKNESAEDEAHTSSDDSEEYVELCRPKTINFVHTPSTNVAQSGQRSTATEASTSDSDVRQILSPADIGSSHEFTAPKSILKKRTSAEQKSEKSQQSEKSEKSQKSEKSSSPIRRKASSQSVQKSISRPSSNVTSTPSRQPLHPSTTFPAVKVIERNTSLSDPSKTNSDSTNSLAADVSSNDDGSKRVSKFKASRLKKSPNSK